MKKSENSKLDITLKDYIDLLNKYNSNMELLNGKCRVLLKEYNVVSTLLSVFITVCTFSVAGCIVLLCELY